jgi:hypothetical protein
MRIVQSGLLVLGVAALMVNPAMAQRGRMSQSAASRNGWLSDYLHATRLARESGKPLMLVFRCVP